MRIFLIRHGNTFESNEIPVQVGVQSDLNLTARGRQQAAEMAEYFATAAISPKVLYSGCLKRQNEAAKIICDRLNLDLDITISTALNELDYGLWEGLTQSSIRESWESQYCDWDERGLWPIGVFGESEEDRISLLNNWLAELEVLEIDGAIAVVTSGGIIKLLFKQFFPERWKELTRKSDIKSLKVKTGHFCELYIPSVGSARAGVELIHWNQNPAEIVL